jgi:hypothetical protein
MASRAKTNALGSLSDPTKTGKREQEILTPQWLLSNLRREWGKIVLDPCSPKEPNVGADYAYSVCGLDWGWPDRTYCNPPYDKLKLWLAWALAQGDARIAILAPARTSRKWYRLALDGRWVVELDPVKFQGYDGTFPAPLHLICLNFEPDPKLWTMGTVRYYPPGGHNGQEAITE